MVQRVSALIQAAALRLESVGIDISAAAYEAKILFGFACGVSLSDIDAAIVLGRTVADLGVAQDIAQGAPKKDAAKEDAPKKDSVESVVKDFNSLITRRASREPMQYIIGTAPFRYIELDVGPGVFIPRPETELLVDEVLVRLRAGRDDARLRSAPHSSVNIVDLCAGSGAIGLSVLTEGAKALASHALAFPTVYAVEKDSKAFKWLERNATKILGVGSSGAPDMRSHFVALNADALDDATLAALDSQVDIVVSNPPYIPQSQVPVQPEVCYDPDTALFGGSDDGLRIPQGVVGTAARLLKPGGLLVMEHDSGQSDALTEYCRGRGFIQVQAHSDLTGRARYVTAIHNSDSRRAA